MVSPFSQVESLGYERLGDYFQLSNPPFFTPLFSYFWGGEADVVVSRCWLNISSHPYTNVTTKQIGDIFISSPLLLFYETQSTRQMIRDRRWLDGLTEFSVTVVWSARDLGTGIVSICDVPEDTCLDYPSVTMLERVSFMLY